MFSCLTTANCTNRIKTDSATFRVLSPMCLASRLENKIRISCQYRLVVEPWFMPKTRNDLKLATRYVRQRMVQLEK